MVNKLKSKKPSRQPKARPPEAKKSAPAARSGAVKGENQSMPKSGNHRVQNERRRDSLRQMLLAKRQEVMSEIKGDLGHSLTEDQMRRLEGMDSGDQAMMDLERELGISLSEMRNRRRQMIDDALIRLEEGTYGICADCGVEISEKRLAAVPFAKYCVECQTQAELLEKIEKEEERD